MFLLLHRVKYRKKVPLGTGTEFQVPVQVQMWTVPNPIINKPNNETQRHLALKAKASMKKIQRRYILQLKIFFVSSVNW